LRLLQRHLSAEKERIFPFLQLREKPGIPASFQQVINSPEAPVVQGNQEQGLQNCATIHPVRELFLKL
jgi:hypothetical protein